MLFFVVLYTLSFIVFITAKPVPSSQWFTVEWDDVEFTYMSGTLAIPSLPKSNGTIFVWPGLQSEAGALQASLNNLDFTLQAIFLDDGHVKLADSLPSAVLPGDDVHFSLNRTESDQWVTTLTGSDVITQTFTIPHKMKRAIFAIELRGVPHDFTVQYTDLVIISATTPASKWCARTGSNGYNAHNTGYSVEGAVAEGNTCSIQTITLPATV